MRASAHRNSSADGHRFCDGGTIVLKRCVAAALIGGVLLADWNQAAIVAQFAFAPADRGGALPGPMPLLPPDNWWNQDISQAPVDPRSPQFIAFINNGGTRRLHPDFGAYEYPGSVGIYGFPYVRRSAAARRAVRLSQRKRRRRSLDRLELPVLSD